MHNANGRMQFVFFSSAAVAVKPLGQFNHITMSIAPDVLAAFWLLMQIHSKSMNWGAVAEVGYVSRNKVVPRGGIGDVPYHLA